MMTLGQAARASGTSKSTIARAIRRGTVSATRSDTGSYSIDPAELARAFPPKPVPRDPSGTVPVTQDSTAVELAVARELVTVLREQLHQTRDDLERWRATAERLTMALPAPPAAPERSRWRRTWRWLRTTG